MYGEATESAGFGAGGKLNVKDQCHLQLGY